MALEINCFLHIVSIVFVNVTGSVTTTIVRAFTRAPTLTSTLIWLHARTHAHSAAYISVGFFDFGRNNTRVRLARAAHQVCCSSGGNLATVICMHTRNMHTHIQDTHTRAYTTSHTTQGLRLRDRFESRDHSDLRPERGQRRRERGYGLGNEWQSKPARHGGGSGFSFSKRELALLFLFLFLF